MIEQLAAYLAAEVEKRVADGHIVYGSQASRLLGPEYERRGLRVGPGVFRGVIRHAHSTGKIRRGQVAKGNGTADVLLPGEGPVPRGVVLDPPPPLRTGDPHPSVTARLGLGSGNAALRLDIYRAFSGQRTPAFARVDMPPVLELLDIQAPGAIAVEPVPRERLLVLWEEAVANVDADPVESSDFAARIEAADLSRAWNRVEGGDLPSLRPAFPLFAASRVEAVRAQLRSWADKHHLDLDAYSLLRVEKASHLELGQELDIKEVARLRARLKRVLDRMTLRQLRELRIPAEFLIDDG